jgi:hypothetical protein
MNHETGRRAPVRRAKGDNGRSIIATSESSAHSDPSKVQGYPALSENLERPNRRAVFRDGVVRLDSGNARQRIHEDLELARLSSVSTRD